MRSTHPAGAVLFEQGEPGDTIYLLAHGRVSMLLERSEGLLPKRVATFAPGVTFGELAMLEERTRTTRAHCDHDVIVWTLSSADLERITRENPPLAASVYRALSRMLATRLRETTRELRDVADP